MSGRLSLLYPLPTGHAERGTIMLLYLLVIHIMATLNIWMAIKLGNCSLEILRMFSCFKEDLEMNRKSALSE